jgi:hypothetical protein
LSYSTNWWLSKFAKPSLLKSQYKRKGAGWGVTKIKQTFKDMQGSLQHSDIKCWNLKKKKKPCKTLANFTSYGVSQERLDTPFTFSDLQSVTQPGWDPTSLIPFFHEAFQ